ncbi:MAG: hemolysin family protein [Vicinamibacterales bacterium]
MLTDLLFVLCLILLNGLFAMSEIAIISSRRARLRQLADAGRKGARTALDLAAEPTRFLSSVQVGITMIGISSGAIGEAAIASRLQTSFERVPALAAHAEAVALVVMVAGLTYVSLILGELVPKRLALTHPERIASLIARPMQWLAAVGRPIVYLLSVSTDTLLRLLGVRPGTAPAVTPEEIRVLLEQGAAEGVFEPAEHEMVTNVLRLDERLVNAVLTPRADVVFLDIRDPLEVHRRTLGAHEHAVLPLCDGGLDHVLGVVRSPKVLVQMLETGAVDLAALAEPPLFVPETMTLMRALEQFKRTHLSIALVVNEYGDVEGLISLTDVIAAVVGDLPGEPGGDQPIVAREDGSWLMEGSLDLDTVARTLQVGPLLNDDDRQHYHTLGGLAMLALGRVPRTGDTFDRASCRFEIVDMDGNRVDRVLVSPATPGRPPDAPGAAAPGASKT